MVADTTDYADWLIHMKREMRPHREMRSFWDPTPPILLLIFCISSLSSRWSRISDRAEHAPAEHVFSGNGHMFGS